MIIAALFLPMQSAQAPLISPEILSHHGVRFRINARKASDITLRGDWMETSEPARLVKDEAGAWSVTVGPLVPDFAQRLFR